MSIVVKTAGWITNSKLRASLNAWDSFFLFSFLIKSQGRELSLHGVNRTIPFFFLLEPISSIFQTINAFIVYWVRGEEKNHDNTLNGIGNM